MDTVEAYLNSVPGRMITVMIAVYFLTQGLKRYTTIKGSAVDAFLPTIPPGLGALMSLKLLPYGLMFNGVIGLVLGGLNVAGYMVFAKVAKSRGFDLGDPDPSRLNSDPPKVSNEPITENSTPPNQPKT